MIPRDGATESLWQETANEFIGNVELAESNYDVIIVGAGITGITLGLTLQTKGLQCLILEAHTLCFGTTGGTTAHINTLLDNPYSSIIKDFGKTKAMLVADAVKEAVAHRKNNIASYNIQCEFQEADAYLFAQNEKQEKELVKFRKHVILPV